MMPGKRIFWLGVFLIFGALKNNLKKYPRQILFCATMFFVPLACSKNPADAVFVVRYFHRTDASLTDSSFMETGDIGPGFRLKNTMYYGDISATEYIKCAS